MSTLITVISSILPALLGIGFAYILTPDWRWSKRTVQIVWLILTGIASILTAWLSVHTEFLPDIRFYTAICTNAILIIPYFLMAEYKHGRSIFAFSSAYTLLMAVSTLSEIASPKSTGIRLITKLIIFALISFLLLRYFRLLLNQLAQEFKGGWLRLSLIPMSFSAIYISIMVSGTLYHDPQLRQLTILLILATLSIYTSLHYIFTSSKAQFAEVAEYEILKEQMHSVQKQTETMLEANEQMNIFRHDMRHYLHILSTCLHNSDTETAKTVLNKMGDNLTSIESKIKQYTGNVLIDAVLSEYVAQAVSHTITFHIHLHLTKELEEEPFSLAVALANGLENAFNACRNVPPEKEKIVQLIGKQNNQQYFLTIENTYSEKVEFTPKQKNPVPTQPGHGYGTKSIMSFAEDKHAQVEFIADETWFRLRIMF